MSAYDVACDAGRGGLKPRGGERLLWLVAYLGVHAVLDLTVAVAVAAATDANMWALGPVFVVNVIIGITAAQAVVGLARSLRERH